MFAVQHTRNMSVVVMNVTNICIYKGLTSGTSANPTYCRVQTSLFFCEQNDTIR